MGSPRTRLSPTLGLVAAALLGAPLLVPGHGWPTAPLLAASADVENPPPEQASTTVRMEVSRGFARLRQGGNERLVLPSDGQLTVVGTFDVELNVGGELSLRFADLGSLRATGPLHMGARSEKNLPQLRFVRLDTVEYEGRRSGPRLELPRGQVLRPRHSAFRLEGRAGGAMDFEHRAGQPVELELGGRYSFELAQGRRIRLPERID
ncbi:MAG: hypothetical protein GC161_05165 [Planctomycetaceae bacterium]|nr:hypothetical protein [Planctomycetaceae bacterium]